MEHIFCFTVCSIQTVTVWNSLSSSALPLQQVAKAETRQHMVKRVVRQVRATSHPEQPSMKQRYYRKTPLASAVESRTGRTKRVGFSSPTGIPEAVQGLHRYVEGGAGWGWRLRQGDERDALLSPVWDMGFPLGGHRRIKIQGLLKIWHNHCCSATWFLSCFQLQVPLHLSRFQARGRAPTEGI